jgi:hypothetical protein
MRTFCNVAASTANSAPIAAKRITLSDRP